MALRVHGIGQCEGVGRSIIDVGRAPFDHRYGLCSGGKVVVTVHPRTAEGLSRANESIPHKASTMLQVLGRSLIIGGGFNMVPGIFMQSTVLERFCGRDVAPPSGTYRPSEQVSDYFVVSRHFRVTRAEVLHVWEFGLHRPFRPTI
eukprot:4983527-Pyramimonas_sp.AAC.1